MTGVSQTGQRVGILKRPPRRAPASSTRSSTWGMTSPARWIRTLSPFRTSRRLISSRLWSEARETVTPPTSTGRSMATGVSFPVRPTCMTMSRISETSRRGSNL